jgi:hypothetical protein
MTVRFEKLNTATMKMTEEVLPKLNARASNSLDRK